MADAAMGFLLETLKQLLLYYREEISSQVGNIGVLYDEIRLLDAKLKDLCVNRSKNEAFKELLRQAKAIIFDAEDEMDRFITMAAKNRALNKVRDICSGRGESIKRLIARVKDIYEKIQRLGLDAITSVDNSNERTKRLKMIPVVEEENVIGFDDEAETIKDRLIQGSKNLEVVSIVGMPGIGKSTLAKMVTRMEMIEYEFSSQAWVYVSRDYDEKEIFLTILSSLVQITDDMRKMGAICLGKLVKKELENTRYLIVMDDIWTVEAWNEVKVAFPNNNKGSRILITSRNTNVARHANPKAEPHNLRFLTDEESWRLLQIKAFGAEDGDNLAPEIVKHGKHIVEECKGLPLAIVVVGGVLLEKGMSGWEKVAKSVDAYISMDQDKRMERIIAMSYDYLSYDLKPCFLYFGMFPEDHEIPVSKLIRLWIAEGFIQEKKGLTLEDVAEEYLENLVNANLVMVGKRGLNRQIKTCRIHDMLHEFCKDEAAQENCSDIKRTAESSSNSNYRRRLSIQSIELLHSLCSQKDSWRRLRSFLSFSPEGTLLQAQDLATFPKAFEYLRVIDSGSITFPQYPTCLKNMIHLRYVLLSSNIQVIPKVISSLWNLQTLIVRTSVGQLDIKADLREMTQLRHLKTNTVTSLSTSRENRDKEMSSSLRTLTTISPESCCIFTGALKLKSLGIRGKLTKLMEIKNGSCVFDEFGKLTCLESLKMMNDLFPLATSQGGKLSRLPRSYDFPPNLRKLTLSDTFLDWENMSTLQMLKNLEVLKVRNRAFEGQRWQVSGEGFPALRALLIEGVDFVTWIAEARQFAGLVRLCIRHCDRLEGIPSISGVQVMELHRCTPAAASCAREIEKMRKGMEGNQSSAATGFKLSIFPPDQA